MIRHIVMWKLKETTPVASRIDNLVKFRTLLEGCRNLVPGTLRLEVGLAKEGMLSTSDIVLVADFADRDALDAYQNHPAHRAVKSFTGAVAEMRQCVDYVI